MGHSARWYVLWVCVTVGWLSSSDVSAQVIELAEANMRQIEALDHEKTVVIMPSELPRIARSHEAIEEDGISPHAGMTETSWMLFLRPDLVAEDVRAAPNLTAGSREEILTIASRPEWAGYFGAPRHATAAYGARHWRAVTDWYVDLALRILDGFDYTELPRRGDMARTNPVNMEIDRAALEREREIEAKQQAWLARQEG